MKKLTSFLKDNPLVRWVNWMTKEEPYRPEKYYMRGPGPKARSKDRPGFTGDTGPATERPANKRMKA